LTKRKLTATASMVAPTSTPRSLQIIIAAVYSAFVEYILFMPYCPYVSYLFIRTNFLACTQRACTWRHFDHMTPLPSASQFTSYHAAHFASRDMSVFVTAMRLQHYLHIQLYSPQKW